MIPIEPASLVMERKMLHGIKQRAERLATDVTAAPSRSGQGAVVNGDESARTGPEGHRLAGERV